MFLCSLFLLNIVCLKAHLMTSPTLFLANVSLMNEWIGVWTNKFSLPSLFSPVQILPILQRTCSNSYMMTQSKTISPFSHRSYHQDFLPLLHGFYIKIVKTVYLPITFQLLQSNTFYSSVFSSWHQEQGLTNTEQQNNLSLNWIEFIIKINIHRFMCPARIVQKLL